MIFSDLLKSVKRKLKDKTMKSKLLIAVYILLFVVPGSMHTTEAAFAQSEANSKMSHLSSIDRVEILRNSNPSISIELEDVLLDEALIEVAKVASVGFYFDASIVPEKKVSLSAEKMPLSEVLNTLLEGTYLEAHTKGRNIMLRVKVLDKREYNLIQTQAEEIFQEMVRGRVVNAETGEGMPGVNIVVQDSELGTVTDIDGNYELEVPSLDVILEFLYIGSRNQVIPVDGRTVINISMENLVIEGEEMIVTAFGLPREARALTYSTQTIGTAELTEAREVNVMNSLQGRVAGLSINQSGSGVGAPTRVILRGNRSISGSSQPLYVVDGVPIQGSPQDLNPDNIESINVLKGPNASALYGSAAQNGVIVVTTKKGQAGNIEVSLNNTFMVDEAIHSLQFQNTYGQGLGGSYIASSEESWGPRMDGQTVDHWSPDPEMQGATYSLTPQPNNVKDGFQLGYNLANNVNASIGGENIQGVFSFTRTDANGIVPGNNLDRQNLSVRLTSQLSDDLTLDGKIDYTHQNIDNPLQQGENNFNPMRQLYRLPRNIRTEDAKTFEYLSPEGLNYQNFWNPGSTNGYNPYYVLNRAISQSIRERVILMTSLSYNISDALTVLARMSYDAANNESNEKLYRDFYARANEGRYSESMSNARQFNSDFLISYTQSLTEEWDFNANIGGSVEKKRNNSLSSNTGSALLAPNFFALSNTLTPQTSYNPGSPRDLQSLYAFAQIGWRNSIYLDITGRNDWSSTLPEENRSYFYPSVGLSAVISDLIPSFPEIVSLARVRASYAEVGNSAGYGLLSRTASFSSGGNNGYLMISSTLPNVDLKPEITKAYELGTDLRFYNGRLGLDITAYRTNTFNQLFSIALPPGSGAANYYTNGGDVQNKGVEVLLSTTPVLNTNLRLDVDFNWAVNRNLVVSVHDDREQVDIGGDSFIRRYIVEAGKPFGEVYSRGFERDEQGRVIVGENGIPQSSGANETSIANFNPDWTGGISSSLAYRNFSLSFLIQHRQGGTLISATNAILYGDGQTEQTLQGREGGLIFGENIFGNETAVYEDGTPNTTEVTAEEFWRVVGGRNAPLGEAFVENATSTRLREMTLGFTIPESTLSALPISNMKISLVGRNLFYLYRASKTLDADFIQGTGTTAEGFQSFAPPTTRSYGVNVKIDF